MHGGLRSRNTNCTAFTASSVVDKCGVFQMEKSIFVVVGCGNGTPVEFSLVVFKVSVGEGYSLFGAGKAYGFGEYLLCC